MADYKLTDVPTQVIRTSDGALIVNGPITQPDWLEYQAWLALGNHPDPIINIVPTLDSIGTGKTTNQILGVA